VELIPYNNEEYGEVIDFLGKLYRLDRERPYWLPGRWEYATYLCSPLFLERGYDDWRRYIRIVRDNGAIVGLVNSENPDHNVYVHTHPDFRALEGELIDWAEQSITTEKISVWTMDDDTRRKELLRSRGFVKEEGSECLNWCSLARHEQVVKLPGGFKIASYKDRFDIASKIECSAKAFNSTKYSEEVYRHMQQAPSYNPALDLVVLEKDTVVSLCTIWVDKKNELACFEPVATAPEYQRRGLGLAILNEGIQRLKEMNIKRAYVGSSGDWRRTFYKKAGFAQSVLSNPWTKQLR
jgi:predicted N-acetyltransferase YhbS